MAVFPSLDPTPHTIPKPNMRQVQTYKAQIYKAQTYQSQDDWFFCLEKGPGWVRLVRRHSKVWKVTKWKEVLGCMVKKRSPFYYYVKDLLTRWSSIGIRVSNKDRRRAEAIPHRRLSRTQIEVYTDFPVKAWTLDQVKGRSDEELLEEFYKIK